jgi:hypothetical protein
MAGTLIPFERPFARALPQVQPGPSGQGHDEALAQLNVMLVPLLLQMQ